MIRFYTAGESHGRAIIAFVEGIPAGLKIDIEKINVELKRRQMGYGRGKRMGIEFDRVEFFSGLRFGETIGAPICAVVFNKDYRNNEKKQDALNVPRPGHADLSGALKMSRKDLRDISERSSARETVGRVVVGAICKQLLEKLNIKIGSYVLSINKVVFEDKEFWTDKNKLLQLHNNAEKSILRIPNREKERLAVRIIDSVIKKGDTLGGSFRVFSINNPIGLGTYSQWNERLDAKIAYYLMSIPAIKSVEVGAGIDSGFEYGSKFHDEIFYKSGRYYRITNNAGGIEGGISNGENIILRCSMKPIPTLQSPLRSVNIIDKHQKKADVVRSDFCAVPAASVIAEAMLAICLANEIKTKFGGDSLKELLQNYNNYLKCQKKI